MKRRLGASEADILTTQNNLAMAFRSLGKPEEAQRLRQEVYSGCLKFHGEEKEATLRAAYNYADTLCELQRFEEAKSLLRRTMPVARRVLGESHLLSL